MTRAHQTIQEIARFERYLDNIHCNWIIIRAYRHIVSLSLQNKQQNECLLTSANNTIKNTVKIFTCSQT